MTQNMDVQNLAIDQIRTNGGTQARASHSKETITEYAEAMQAGRPFPALIVFEDDGKYWLADGFHRLEAARVAGRTEMECEVRKGTLDDAKWFACGANVDHGLRRTTADKREAIRRALLHPKGSGLSDRQIAEYVGVSHRTVAKERADLHSTGQLVQFQQRLGKDNKFRPLPEAKRQEPGWWWVGHEQNPTGLMNSVFAVVKRCPDVHGLLKRIIEERGLADDPHEQLCQLASVLAFVELDRVPERPFGFNFADYFRHKDAVPEPPAEPDACPDQRIWERWLYQDYRRAYYEAAGRSPSHTNPLFWKPVDDLATRARAYIQEHNEMPPWKEFRPELDFTDAASWYPPFIRESGE